MNKTISILILLVSVSVLAEENPAVKINIPINGLYVTRTSASSRVRSTEAAIMDGLRALKSSQNEDGSWRSD